MNTVRRKYFLFARILRIFGLAISLSIVTTVAIAGVVTEKNPGDGLYLVQIAQADCGTDEPILFRPFLYVEKSRFYDPLKEIRNRSRLEEFLQRNIQRKRFSANINSKSIGTFVDLKLLPARAGEFEDYPPDVELHGAYEGNSIPRRLRRFCNGKKGSDQAIESPPWTILAPTLGAMREGRDEEMTVEEKSKFADLLAGPGKTIVLERVLDVREIRDRLKAKIQDDSRNRIKDFRAWKFDVLPVRDSIRELEVVSIGEERGRAILGIYSVSGSIVMNAVHAQEKRVQFFAEAAFLVTHMQELQLITMCATGQPCLHAGASLTIPGQKEPLLIFEKKWPQKDEVGFGGTSMVVFRKQGSKWIKALETQPVSGFSF